ncbi:hypothetical protein [Comamonas thiooxydans]|uniref:hypothetical protein n=1 Tax=Comamonas thiooxydans TaxID=363952 RepID=UPI000B409115|nr:hypothetical protein [Comamonas thiooxydans]
MTTIATQPEANRVLTTAEKCLLADKAYVDYDFGENVEITDHGGWSYSTPGNEWTRKVYVEMPMEDDGPAPRSVLNFNVRFSPTDGSFVEAIAFDEKGCEWGSLAAVPVLYPGEVVEPVNPSPANPEVMPGATAQEIDHVQMQDLVGDYDNPDDVPEWAWVQQHACYAHVQNGQHGIWEFVLNLACELPDIPEKLLPTIKKAKVDGIAYLVIHQGT